MTHGASMSIAIMIAVLAAAGTYGFAYRAPACDSDWTLSRVYATLRDQSRLTSIYLNNTENVAGGYFAIRRDCSAQVAEIRGNVSPADTQWRALRYSIAPSPARADPVVTVQLGENQSYIRPSQSLLRRLFGPP